MGHEESEHLALDLASGQEDVTGAEVPLGLPVHVESDVLAVEIKRNGLAFKQLELLRTVKQGHVHASSVRAVVVHDLVVGVRDLRLPDQILKHVTVLHLAQSQNRVERLVLVRHRLHDGGDVVELAVVARVSPAVRAVREIFIVILAFIVVGVEEILDIVEADDIAPCALVSFGARRDGNDKKQERGIKYSFKMHIDSVLIH